MSPLGYAAAELGSLSYTLLSLCRTHPQFSTSLLSSYSFIITLPMFTFRVVLSVPNFPASRKVNVLNSRATCDGHRAALISEILRYADKSQRCRTLEARDNASHGVPVYLPAIYQIARAR